VRSLSGLIANLGREVRFFLVARDHDIGDRTQYRGVDLTNWNRSGLALVRYISDRRPLASQLAHITRSREFDVVYLNSIFSPLARSYLLLRRLGMVRKRPLIVAPRGELGTLALSLKTKRKRTFLWCASVLRLYEGVIWIASSTFERDDIRAALGLDERGDENRDIRVVPNIARPIMEYASPSKPKKPGVLRLVFLSRIDRKKNLDGALRMLHAFSGRVTFDIYGPVGDQPYLNDCERVAANLPGNVQVRFMGELDTAMVPQTLREYDLFLLPTLNENFGHVIIEALGAGCPVLISDQTAWRGLEAEGAGWDVPVREPDRFVQVLDRVAAMGEDEIEHWRVGAWRYATRAVREQQAIETNRALFQQFRRPSDTGVRA
jgi:glycosyltransferase involved in cell wall biosynthesis